MMQNLVEIRGLRVEATTDAGRCIEIIKGVSLDVAPGEILALIGESGSGKTTIAMALLGHARCGCRISGGSVVVAGRDMAALPERARAAVRGTVVSYVPQSAAGAFDPSQRIMDQVIEITRIHRLMPRAAAEAKAVALFRALSLPEPERIGARYPHQVSGGQLQRLSAAMALIGDPQLVVFDEPTTALDVTTQIEVLRAFRSVMALGRIAGVYVSHDLAVVAQIADRIAVLRDGEVLEMGTTQQILSAPTHPYTRELLDAFRPAQRIAAAPPEAAAAPVLEVRGLSAGYGQRSGGAPLLMAVQEVGFRLERGRNLGIIGESGCGKSTLARSIAGILPHAAGSILLNGAPLAPLARDRAREELRRLQIVFQSADTALNPARPVGDILGRPLRFYHGLRGAAQAARVDQLLDMVQLPRALKYRHPPELSGGQKQRVNLARALAAEPDVVLCDEITSALDSVVAAAIIALLKELQRDLGLSYVFISHDIPTVQAICDEVAVMYKGRKVEHCAAAEVGRADGHPYARLLTASVPRLDPGWLDGLERDPDLVAAFSRC
jgi:peptide/nickel transport system ATP-binding protein